MTTEPREPSEEELRAAYEAEIKRLRVEHVLLDNVVALANLGMRRTGLAPGTEGERDPAQVRLAIEAIRAMLPLLEQSAPDQIGGDSRRRVPAADGIRPHRGTGTSGRRSKRTGKRCCGVGRGSARSAGASAEARRAGACPAQRPSLDTGPIA